MPNKPVFDLSGAKYGRWTVESYAGQRYWLCVCDCGKRKQVPGHYLRRGVSRSCGCLAVEKLTERHRTHGLRNTPEWECWAAMRRRCENPKAQAFSNYGGRGISVCSRWNSFENFIADMGRRPSDRHSLDRIDNDGNYEPNNCRWLERSLQELNKRSNRILTYQNEAMPLSEWSRRTGIKAGTIGDRLSYGWSVEDALTKPVRSRRVVLS